MLYRFDKLDRLCSEIYDEMHNGFAPISYQAHYSNLETIEKACLRIGSLASMLPGNLLEVGIDSGFGALSMAICSGSNQVYSCDIRKECVEVARQRANRLFIKNVTFFHGTLSEMISELEIKDASMIYIDGSHTEEDCLNDIKVSSQSFGDDFIIALDDMMDPLGENFDSNGVLKAIHIFMEENKDYHGVTIQGGLFIMSKSKYHPSYLGFKN